MKQISIGAFHQLWKEQQESGPCFLIDVRTPEEYAQGHVPGARLICLDTLDTRAHEISKDVDTYLICRSGARSAKALEWLRDQHGFIRLTNVSGGTMAWIEAGYPVEVAENTGADGGVTINDTSIRKDADRP